MFGKVLQPLCTCAALSDSCNSSSAHSLMTYNRMMSVQAEALLARAPRHTGRRMAAIGSVSSVPSLKP